MPGHPAGVRHSSVPGELLRDVQVSSRCWVRSRVERARDMPRARSEAELASVHEASWLRATAAPAVVAPSRSRGTVRGVDLFSGCGGLSLGAWEACRALKLSMEHVLIADTDERAQGAFARFFGLPEHVVGDVLGLVDGQLGGPLTVQERAWRRRLGQIDLLLAGPPCQGHSNLNNHTRRDDVRNLLYLRVARFVEVFRPRAVLIENVPTVVHDKARVVEVTKKHLQSLPSWRRRGVQFGRYSVDEFHLRGTDFGIPQTRKRHFLIASTGWFPRHEQLLATHGAAPRGVLWAIDDLLEAEGRCEADRSRYFDSAPVPSAENRRRIKYLFERRLYELPDSQRPPCHRAGGHSYGSVYGRLRPDRPAPTITTGFGSPGQGRFIHPLLQRTLTPHEAARLQYFPDFFVFDDPGMNRNALHKLIGNAVPPRFAYILALELLRGLDC